MADIDELVVKLKANIKNFETNMKKAMKTSGKTTGAIRKGFDKLKRPLRGVKDSVLSFKGALAAAGAIGAASFVKGTLESADALAKLASNIGISSNLLQELQFAASQTGVAQNDLNSSMLRFNRRLSEAANGNAGFKKSYDELGISVNDANGNLRSADEVLFDVADAVGKMGSEADQARILFNLFGDSGFRLVNLFKNGAPALRQFQNKARELGLVIGADVLQSAEGATDKLDIMNKVVSAKLTNSVVKLIPAINAIADGIVLLADVTEKGFTQFERFGSFLGESTAKLVNFVTGVKEVPPEIEAMVVSTKKNTKAQEADKAAMQAASAAMKKHGEFVARVTKIVAESNKARNQEIGKALEEEVKLLQKASEQRLEIDGELQEALMAKREELDEFQMMKNEEEIERLIEKNQLLSELNTLSNADEIAKNEAKIRDLMANEKLSTDFTIREKLRMKKANAKFLDDQLSASRGFFGDLMTLSAGSNRGLFETAKAFATATAIIEGLVAVQRAFANPPGPPFSIPIAAAAATRAAVTVSKIQSTNFQTGVDNVPGIGKGDNFPAMLAPQERVLSTDQNKVFTSFMSEFMRGMDGGGGGGGGTTRVEISVSPDAAELIEARLIERNRLGFDSGLV